MAEGWGKSKFGLFLRVEEKQDFILDVLKSEVPNSYPSKDVK